jgi:tetratricopeptide (TPR) repeat protein
MDMSFQEVLQKQGGFMKRFTQLFVIAAVTPLLFSYGSKPKPLTDTSPQYMKDYNAGIDAQKQKNYEGAIDFFKTAVGQKEDFSEAWNNMGYSYRMLAKDKLDQSGDAYSKAIKYDPNNEDALEYQGEYFLMVGKLKEAYQNYQKLKQLNSSQAKELKKKLDDVLNQAKVILKEYSPN